MGRVAPWSIDEGVTDPLTGVTAWPVFDRQRGDYYAEVNGDMVRAERASDLLRKLAEALRRGFGLKWERVILLERGAPARFVSRGVNRDGMHVGISLGAARGEIATRARDGATLFRGWPPEEIDEDLPEGLNPADLRVVSVLPSSVLVRTYTEAAWRGVLAGMLTIDRARQALEAAATVEGYLRAVDLRTLLAEVRAAESKPKEE